MKTSYLNASHFDYSSRPVFEGEPQTQHELQKQHALHHFYDDDQLQQQHQQQEHRDQQQQHQQHLGVVSDQQVRQQFSAIVYSAKRTPPPLLAEHHNHHHHSHSHSHNHNPHHNQYHHLHEQQQQQQHQQREEQGRQHFAGRTVIAAADSESDNDKLQSVIYIDDNNCESTQHRLRKQQQYQHQQQQQHQHQHEQHRPLDNGSFGGCYDKEPSSSASSLSLPLPLSQPYNARTHVSEEDSVLVASVKDPSLSSATTIRYISASNNKYQQLPQQQLSLQKTSSKRKRETGCGLKEKKGTTVVNLYNKTENNNIG